MGLSPDTAKQVALFGKPFFSMVRTIHGKQPGDPMKDLNVNLAIWAMFMNTTFRASVHLQKTVTRIYITRRTISGTLCDN